MPPLDPTQGQRTLDFRRSLLGLIPRSLQNLQGVLQQNQSMNFQREQFRERMQKMEEERTIDKAKANLAARTLSDIVNLGVKAETEEEAMALVGQYLSQHQTGNPDIGPDYDPEAAKAAMVRVSDFHGGKLAKAEKAKAEARKEQEVRTLAQSFGVSYLIGDTPASIKARAEAEVNEALSDVDWRTVDPMKVPDLKLRAKVYALQRDYAQMGAVAGRFETTQDRLERESALRQKQLEFDNNQKLDAAQRAKDRLAFDIERFEFVKAQKGVEAAEAMLDDARAEAGLQARLLEGMGDWRNSKAVKEELKALLEASRGRKAAVPAQPVPAPDDPKKTRMRELLKKGSTRTLEEEAEFLDLTGGR